MQGVYKMQGFSMVSGDVDATLLSEIVNLKREQCVSAFI